MGCRARPARARWGASLGRLALALAAACATGGAAAQSFPDRPLQLVVPFAAGGGLDATARHFAQAFAAALRQPVTVVNIDGAAGTLGLGQVARARADGYTLVFAPAVSVTSEPHRNKSVAYALSSFRPICQVFENLLGLGVPRDSPYKTWADLMADARRRPGQLLYGIPGIGTIPHLAVSEIEAVAGVEFNAVPYRGDGPMQVDLFQGRLGFSGILPSSFAGQLRSGELRLLAMLSERRHTALPDVPTLTQLGLPVVHASFGGVLAPAELPPAVADVLEAGCTQALAAPAFNAWADSAFQGLAHAPGSAFAARLRKDSEAKAAGLKRLKLIP